MCGIAGMVRLAGGPPIDRAALERMQACQLLRGPDGRGTKVGDRAGLAAVRLAVMDPSERGNLPMVSPDGRYWIVHNGEIYNHAELRAELESQGHRFRSSTDTEVLLRLYARDGAEMLSRCNGMFAFAVWDDHAKRLFAARDRFGEKPFLYAVRDGTFYFASEHKALFAAGVEAAFDTSTWAELMWFRYVAGERTPFEGVRRLLPGHHLVAEEHGVRTRPWWTLEPRPDADEAEFPALLEDAVSLRRRADVPVGVLLSGGLDSSSVAMMLADQAGEGVRSFTVRFEEPGWDEGRFARMVVASSGLDRQEVTVRDDEVPGLLEEVTWLRGEPSVQAAAPHLLAVCRRAREQVTVLLGGEGADETLGGYDRYRKYLSPKGMAVRAGTRAGASWLWPRRERVTRRASKLGRVGPARWTMEGHAFGQGRLPPDGDGGLAYRAAVATRAAERHPDLVRQALDYEQHTWLQSILDCTDRSSMGASVECRLPFLDHRLVELVAGLPTSSLFHRGTGKSILRRAMADRLPEPVLNRPKQGFSAPWHRYWSEIPGLRAWVAGLPDLEVVRSSPLHGGETRDAVRRFLGGGRRDLDFVGALARVALWHEVCVRGERGVLG